MKPTQLISIAEAIRFYSLPFNTDRAKQQLEKMGALTFVANQPKCIVSEVEKHIKQNRPAIS